MVIREIDLLKTHSKDLYLYLKNSIQYQQKTVVNKERLLEPDLLKNLDIPEFPEIPENIEKIENKSSYKSENNFQTHSNQRAKFDPSDKIRVDVENPLKTQ